MARILIVEDNEALGNLLVLALDCLGYEVTLATTGKEALKLLAEFHHEVVFCEFQMKPMSGLDFISKVKELHPRTVLAFISDKIDPDVEDMGIEMGALAFVQKPINIDELQGILLRALKRAERKKKGKILKSVSSAPAAKPSVLLLGPPAVERMLLVAVDEVIRHSAVARLAGKGLEVSAVSDGFAAIAALGLSIRPFDAVVIISPLTVLEAGELGAQLARLYPRLRLGLLGENTTTASSTPFHRIGPPFRTCEDLENIYRALVTTLVERPAA
jgi:CheY-like chemotaxis protein